MLRRLVRLPPSLTPSLRRIGERLAGYRPRCADSPGAVWAAVALLVTPDPDAVLLIRRADRRTDPWSGQIGLPGGRRAPGDPDLLATAIRETAEEVGVALVPDDRLGVLDDVAPLTPTLPPVAVRPYVFGLADRAPLRLNAEVASAHWVTLDRLRRPDAHALTPVWVGGERRLVPAYRDEDLVVWGLTERILSCFLAAVADS